MLRLNLFFFLLLGCFLPLQAEDLSKIQAAASLLYHIENRDDPEAIPFESSEVAKLWKNLESEEVSEAHEAYLQGDYWRSSQLLHKSWEDWINQELEVDLIPQASSTLYNDLGRNPYVSDKILGEIFPYILPYEHHARPYLDLIFQTSRATYNKDTLRNAGFTILYSQPRSFIKVVQHALLPNFLLKLYIDVDLRKKRNRPGWSWFVRRCEGAEKIRKIIKKYNVANFVVPHKWLYPLPIEPSPPTNIAIERQIVVLLVDDMHLVPKEENIAAWKTRMTKKHLDELYLVISLGNGSSYRADNIPYTKQGKFAFIDTEYPHRPPNFSSVRAYLSTRMRTYWDDLVKKGGKG